MFFKTGKLNKISQTYKLILKKFKKKKEYSNFFKRKENI